MKRICRVGLFLLGLMGLAWTVASACTIITMARGGKVWIGNNEDWTDPRTKMWIIPACPGEYGRVVFGFENRFIQGGINEHGLFLDANALQPPGWKPDPAKPLFEDSFDKQIGDYILAHCASVADAITFFKTYSVFLDGGKFVIADAGGESITVEWAEGQDRITRRDGTYQVSSNIPQWNIVPGKVDDPRYNIAERSSSAAMTCLSIPCAPCSPPPTRNGLTRPSIPTSATSGASPCISTISIISKKRMSSICERSY